MTPRPPVLDAANTEGAPAPRRQMKELLLDCSPEAVPFLASDACPLDFSSLQSLHIRSSWCRELEDILSRSAKAGTLVDLYLHSNDHDLPEIDAKHLYTVQKLSLWGNPCIYTTVFIQSFPSTNKITEIIVELDLSRRAGRGMGSTLGFASQSLDELEYDLRDFANAVLEKFPALEHFRVRKVDEIRYAYSQRSDSDDADYEEIRLAFTAFIAEHGIHVDVPRRGEGVKKIIRAGFEELQKKGVLRMEL
ncbi:hypothetical protein MKEN_00178700 [Mycena kentingensis (nom. inval.)]|nr:hypothetical protein MKEN_00178700 [Mycena kentingensis (nom. inval.)]